MCTLNLLINEQAIVNEEGEKKQGEIFRLLLTWKFQRKTKASKLHSLLGSSKEGQEFLSEKQMKSEFPCTMLYLHIFPTWLRSDSRKTVNICFIMKCRQHLSNLGQQLCRRINKKLLACPIFFCPPCCCTTLFKPVKLQTASAQQCKALLESRWTIPEICVYGGAHCKRGEQKKGCVGTG